MLYGDKTNPLTISSKGPTSYTVIRDKERELYDRLLQLKIVMTFLRLYNI